MLSAKGLRAAWRLHTISGSSPALQRACCVPYTRAGRGSFSKAVPQVWFHRSAVFHTVAWNIHCAAGGQRTLASLPGNGSAEVHLARLVLEQANRLSDHHAAAADRLRQDSAAASASLREESLASQARLTSAVEALGRDIGKLDSDLTSNMHKLEVTVNSHKVETMASMHKLETTMAASVHKVETKLNIIFTGAAVVVSLFGALTVAARAGFFGS